MIACHPEFSAVLTGNSIKIEGILRSITGGEIAETLTSIGS